MVELSDKLTFQDIWRLSLDHEIDVITYNPLRIGIKELHGNMIKFYELHKLKEHVLPVMICYLSHPALDYINDH